MPTYNVRVSVVELIDADSPAVAVEALTRWLSLAAFLSDVDTEGNPQ